MILWLTLIISLPTENATARMRIWRGLKASGAAVLRDGVYLLPDSGACLSTLESLSHDVVNSGGVAHLLRVQEPEGAEFAAMFDRSNQYAELLQEMREVMQQLSPALASESLKRVRKLRKGLSAITAIDFFAGEAARQAETAIQELELAVARALTPDEPHPTDHALKALDARKFQGKTWATRERPWVDRLACAWLIRTFIDQRAQFIWLSPTKKCPREAIGFDFDGATFTHAGARVTFEVMLASFGLETEPLLRMGRLVHFLDVGGVQPVEAPGLETVLRGMCQSLTDDHQLLATACQVFDGLLHSFTQDEASHGKR